MFLLFFSFFSFYSADSENDSGYDPSQYSNSMPIGNRKSRATIEGFFDSIDKHVNAKGIQNLNISHCVVVYTLAGVDVVLSAWANTTLWFVTLCSVRDFSKRLHN